MSFRTSMTRSESGTGEPKSGSLLVHPLNQNQASARMPGVNIFSELERAVLPNGEMVVINDHVYASPSWSERDGSPYNIARIIEFVPAEAARHSLTSRKQPSQERHVRLAFYYRQSEVSGRAASDHRLLFAAIHSEVHPISWLRGKCYVRHREKIQDLSDWKKRPDHFHYLKLYDPYIRREFELIRTDLVQNVPPLVRIALTDRYEFIAVEKEIVADLIDSFRTCNTCKKWASSQESVRCETCKLYYHMSCVQPALQSKPAKGYSWVCLTCSKAQLIASGQLEASEAQTAAPIIPIGRNTIRTRQAAISKKDKERSLTPNSDQPERFFRGWNFRYFGQYTDVWDTLDPDDYIWPRLAIRLGQRYQANVPDWDDQAKLNEELGQEDLPERGTDDRNTSVLLSKPADNLGSFMTQVRSMKLVLPPTDLEVQIKALLLNSHQGPAMAMRTLETCKLADFRYIKDMTDTELKIFEAQVEKYGALENHSTAKMIQRKPGETVRLYYRWRNQKLAVENRKIRESRQVKVKVQPNGHKAGKGKKHAKPLPPPPLPSASSASAILNMQRDSTPESDAEGSIWEQSDIPDKTPTCAICAARKSPKWWKAPRHQGGSYLCDHCGLSYRKYGVATAYKPKLDRRNSEKREASPADGPLSKRQKTLSAIPSRQATPPPPPPPPQPCLLCYEQETDRKPLVRCKNCTLTAHIGCYGIPDKDVSPDWLCDPCANEKNLAASLDVYCVLCPTKLLDKTRAIPKSVKVPPEFDFMQVMRPTEGYKWVHLLCALYTKEVKFSDAERMKPVEGIMDIRAFKDETCPYCAELGGAVVNCKTCNETFHTSCGYLSGCTFGFQLQEPLSEKALMKVPKKDRMPSIPFDNKLGRLTPVAWCKTHSSPGELGVDSRAAYKLSDLDNTVVAAAGSGTVAPIHPLSAMQVYAQRYKSIPSSTDENGGVGAATFPLLRKAERVESFAMSTGAFEDIIPEDDDDIKPEDDEAINAIIAIQEKKMNLKAEYGKIVTWSAKCETCGTDVSPRWYQVPSVNRVEESNGNVLSSAESLSSASNPSSRSSSPSTSSSTTTPKLILSLNRNNNNNNSRNQAAKKKKRYSKICHQCHHNRIYQGQTRPTTFEIENIA